MGILDHKKNKYDRYPVLFFVHSLGIYQNILFRKNNRFRDCLRLWRRHSLDNICNI